MFNYKSNFQFLLLFFSVICFGQSSKNEDLRGEFTYLLKAKFDQRSEHRHKELFLLQVGENKTFFASTTSLKGDSVMEKSSVMLTNPNGSVTIGYKKGTLIPKTNFNFTIIQSNYEVQYFDLVGMSLLMYKEPTINNWKLVEESQVINTIFCKKAEVRFKGRNWIAWYSPEIPFPNGPMKFSGLPGLIIKITDDKGEFDFELVKSITGSKLNGKLVSLKKSRFTNAILTTQTKLKQAKQNANASAAAFLASYNTTIISGQEKIKEREKAYDENKKYANSLELED